MTASHPQHLSWDDLDDLLMGTERQSVHVHLETCAECRKLAATDLQVVVQLQRLPLLAPTEGFADRVMAGIAVADRLTVRPSDRLPLMKAAAVVLTLGSLGTSLGWSLANQSLLLSLRGDALSLLQTLIQNVAAAISLLPHSAPVQALRDSVGGVGVGLILTALAGTYLAGLLTVRLLVALPSRTA
jgi:anti-sigma factor RsiW